MSTSVVFSNPGTSEMHFVAALDSVPQMREVFFAYSRALLRGRQTVMRAWPKSLLLLCSILVLAWGNAIANLHNAQKAFPLVNIVGEHTTHHRKYEAPLTSNIEGYAEPFKVAEDLVKRQRMLEPTQPVQLQLARLMYGYRETLLLPANTAGSWRRCAEKVTVPDRKAVDSAAIREPRPSEKSGGKL